MAFNSRYKDDIWCKEFDHMQPAIQEIICQNIYKYVKKGLSLKDVAYNAGSSLNEIRVAHVLDSEFYQMLAKDGHLGAYPYND